MDSKIEDDEVGAATEEVLKASAHVNTPVEDAGEKARRFARKLKADISPVVAKAKEKAAPVVAKAKEKAAPTMAKVTDWAKKQPLAAKAVGEMRKRPKVFNRRNAIIAACIVLFILLADGDGGSGVSGGRGDFDSLFPSVPLHPAFASQFGVKAGSDPARVALKCRNILCDSDNWLEAEDYLTKDARHSLREEMLRLDRFDSDHLFKENWTVIVKGTAIVSMVTDNSNSGGEESIFWLKRIDSRWLIYGMDDFIGEMGYFKRSRPSPHQMEKRKRHALEIMGRIPAKDMKKACASSFKSPSAGEDRDFDAIVKALKRVDSDFDDCDEEWGFPTSDLAQARGYRCGLSSIVEPIIAYGKKRKNNAYYWSLKEQNTVVWGYFLYDNKVR